MGSAGGMKLVTDTGTHRVFDLIELPPAQGRRLDVVTANLSIFALGELLPALRSSGPCRFVLPADPAVLSLLGSAADRAARNRLRSRWLARSLREWLADNADIRLANSVIPQGALVIRDGDGQVVQALLGSLALTTDGLGLTPGNPLSLIQASQTPEEAALLSQWFDNQWASLPDDPHGKATLIEAINAIASHRNPYLVYALVLHHLFAARGEELDEEQVVKSATGIRNTVVWKKLFEFQRDGVVGTIDKLNRFGEGYRYDVPHPVSGKPCKEPLMGYRFRKETMDELLAHGRILFGEDESKIIELKVYASEYKDKLSSVLELDGRLGAYDLRADFPENGRVFSNPKPVRLLSTLLSFILREDGDIVIDFFAGSGATAKAVWELNSGDEIERRYVMVQLPEPLDSENKEQITAAGFCDKLGKPRNIAELTKERLRGAAKKIKDENPMFAGDLGFRVFKLDSSNIRAWEPDRDDLDQTLLDSVEHLKEGRTEADVLYELLLKLGLDRCVPIETRAIAAKEVHAVGGGVLMTCLAEDIARDEVEALAQGIVGWHEELAPAGDTTCVFRDSAFADDVAKTNIAAILEQYGIANVRSL